MDEDDGLTRTPPRSALLTFGIEHLALLASITGAVIFALRCVVVSEGNVYVASILVAETSVGDAIRALLFTVAPLLLFLLAFAATYVWSRRILNGRWRNLETLGFVILSFAASTGAAFLRPDIRQSRTEFLLSASIPLLYGLGPLILNLPLSYFQKRARFRRLSRDLLPMMMGLLFLAGGITIGESLLSNKSFWLPPERLVFKGEAAFTGYVLKTNEDHLVILIDNPRVTIEKPKADLSERNFCYPTSDQTRDKLAGRPLPDCP